MPRAPILNTAIVAQLDIHRGTNRATQSFRQEEIKVPFERASARCSISPHLANSNAIERSRFDCSLVLSKKERERIQKGKRGRGPLLVR